MLLNKALRKRGEILLPSSANEMWQLIPCIRVLGEQYLVEPLLRRRLRVERLERRLLPSTILWTGAAGDYLWLTPQNWQGSVLPTPADDAVIGSSTTGLPIIVNGFVWVHSVSSNQTIDLPTGGTLTLSAASSQFSNLILDGGLFDPQPEAVLANSLISGPGGLTVQTG